MNEDQLVSAEEEASCLEEGQSDDNPFAGAAAPGGAPAPSSSTSESTEAALRDLLRQADPSILAKVMREEGLTVAYERPAGVESKEAPELVAALDLEARPLLGAAEAVCVTTMRA